MLTFLYKSFVSPLKCTAQSLTFDESWPGPLKMQVAAGSCKIRLSFIDIRIVHDCGLRVRQKTFLPQFLHWLSPLTLLTL